MKSDMQTSEYSLMDGVSSVSSPIRWLFIALLIFFPMVDIRGVPLALPLLLLPFCFKYRLPSAYLMSGFLGAGIIGVMTLSNIYTAETVILKDLLYWTLPLLYPVFIAAAIVCLQPSCDNYRSVHRIVKGFLLLQFIVAVLQFINPVGINSVFEPYYQILAVNVGGAPFHGSAEVLQRRPSGTVGISTRLGFVAYVLGRFLTIYTRRYRYVLLAFLLALLASARMALLTIVVTETLLLGLPLLRSRTPEIKVRQLIAVVISVSVVGIGIATVHPFLRQFLIAALSGDLISTITSMRSIQHRIQSYSYLIESPGSFFIGGLVLSDLHTFAYDSELVMRTLQFGILGYLGFKLPLVACWLRGIQLGDVRLRRLGAVLVLVAVLSSLTMTVSSSMYFILLLSVLIASGEVSSWSLSDM